PIYAPASTSTASTASTSPRPAPVPPAGTVTCRDQMAHTPVTTEIPQPTAESQARPNQRRASASAEQTSPNTSDVPANSGGIRPSGARPASTSQPRTAPVHGSISEPI